VTVSRRDLFKLAGALGGALVLGFDPGCAIVPGRGRVRRAFDATGEFQPSAWLRILPDDRIIFTLDRVEMGQGTTTSHATMIAEELDVDPRRIEIEHAGAGRAYDNPDSSLGFQITGGSTSVATSWQPLREAGAAAREMLRRGAAATWGVALDEVVAKDGVVTHAASKRRATYGALAEAASAQDVPEVRLKDPREWRWLGTSVDRLDARPKIDGSGVYGIDVRLPDMLTAVVIRPPVRGAKVRRFDAAAARARRGVTHVFETDAGIAVVARSYWEARTAADLVTVEWDERGAAVVDSAALMRTYEALAARPGKTARNDGDAVRALDGAPADRTIDATYHLPFLAHATMEPMNATAHVTDGGCDVWAPTQAPGVARWRVAEALGLDLADVRVHTTLIGGGFGRRIWQDYAVEAAVIARVVRVPVQVIWSREDDLENDFYRPMAVSRMRGAVAPGKILAWHHRLVTDSIVAHEGGDFVGAIAPDATPRMLRRWATGSVPRNFLRGLMIDPSSTEGAAELPYAIPDLRVEFTVAETGVPIGFWRSVGHSHNAFVTEAFLDELIHAAGGDAYHMRRALLADHPRHLRVLDLAAKAAGWDTAPAAGVGRGIAVHGSFESYCAQVIEASVDGGVVRVHRVVVAIDCGRVVNPGIVRQQMESAVIFGLSAALWQQVTFVKGRVQETNFRDYKMLRMHQCPAIEVHLVEDGADPTGVGEPGVPPVAPALCGAIFAATGQRIRRLPIEAALAEAT
jgi:isoquinoline 1-oxidoreductase beta subunit